MTKRHFRGKFVGKTHHREKFLLPLRQRLDHGGGEHGENIGITFGQRPMLRERPQVQVYGGKPPFAGIQQGFDLRIGKLGTASVRINGKLRVVQPQVFRADLVNLAPQPDDFRSGQKPVPAGNDQVYVAWQTVCKGAEKIGNAAVRQQVKIVNKDVAGGLSRQFMAEIIRQQSPTGGVRGAGIVPQEVKARPHKGVLCAFPEDLKVIGIDADADDMDGLCFGALLQIPVHCRCLAITHGRHHRGQGAARDGPQALLQSLGYVNGIQVPF